MALKNLINSSNINHFVAYRVKLRALYSTRLSAAKIHSESLLSSDYKCINKLSVRCNFARLEMATNRPMCRVSDLVKIHLSPLQCSVIHF